MVAPVCAQYTVCTNKNPKMLAEMGSGKNKKNSDVSKGKLKKRAVPQRWQTKETANSLQEGETKSPLEGSWIINLAQLAAFVREISAHSASCQQGTIMLTGERNREGLASVLSARCSSCRLKVAFPTASKVSGVRAGQRWEYNLAAVWGQMSTGGGPAPLAETMSVLGVPVMTKKSFMATEKALGRAWWEALEESMKEAAEEEKRNAIEQGSLHEGVPAIPVIVDC